MTRDEQWLEKYNAAREAGWYKVLKTFGDPLGKWLYDQWKAYKSGTMSEYRRNMLDALPPASIGKNPSVSFMWSEQGYARARLLLARGMADQSSTHVAKT